jgi:hypothetical protein
MAEDIHVSIEDFFPSFFDLHEGVNATPLPHLDQVINTIAQEVLVTWRKFTMGEPIPGTPRVINSRGDYTKSIILFDQGENRIIESKGPWTGWIEKGHGEIDLKPGLLHGPKARMGKKGPYTIVSFRSGVPTTLRSNDPMPPPIYRHMKKITNAIDEAYASGESAQPGTSRVIGKKFEIVKNSKGILEKRVANNYRWGYRLPKEAGGNPETKQVQGGTFHYNGTTYQVAKGAYTWKSGKHSNMVRMDTTAGLKRTSEYRTFRVVSYKSDPRSWIIPELAPLPIREKVIEAITPKANEIIRTTLEEDLR